MKRVWADAEIAEYWFLFPREKELQVNKHGTTRLGFALLLKFFSLEGRFPTLAMEIPRAVVPFVAGQIGADPEGLDGYPWEGATIKRHRAEIREWCGFREISGADLEQLQSWLIEDPALHGAPEEHLREALLHRCKDLKIEPPVSSHAQRLLQCALHAHETRFCERIFQKPQPGSRSAAGSLAGGPQEGARKRGGGLDAVAGDERGTGQGRGGEHEGSHDPPSDGAGGGASRGSLSRGSAEGAGALRAPGGRGGAVRVAPPAGPLRATLLAAYLHRRSETLTDHLVDLLIETFHKMAKRFAHRRNQPGDWLKGFCQL